MKSANYWVVLFSLLVATSCTDKPDSKDTVPSTQPPVTSTQLPKPLEQGTDDTPSPANTAMPTQTDTAAMNSSQATDLDLARKSGCLACHALDKKVVGPAWMDVAKRYQGHPETRERLISKVKTGGRGAWTEVVGNVAMPPYSPRVSDENIGKLVDFILGLVK